MKRRGNVKAKAKPKQSESGMTTAYEEKYRCGECDTLHDYEDHALECCAPEVEHVFVCDDCEAEMKTEELAKAHICGRVDPPEWVDGDLCLCGAMLTADDHRPSMLLGDQVRCARCRTKIESGVPSGEAVRQSFTERALAIR